MKPRESAGGIIKGPDGRIVIVRQNGDSWAFPKGGVEEGETLLLAALREIREETGLSNVEYICELGHYERYSIGKGGVGEQTEFGLRKRSFFLFRTARVRLVPQDKEITEARWVSPDEALALLTHPKDREFLASIRSKVEEVR